MSNQRSKQNPKRHCMVVHAYYPIGETRVEREARALIDRGTEVDVICLRFPDEEPAYSEVNGVRVYRTPMWRHKRSSLIVQLFEYLAFFVLAFIRLTKLHLERGYDIVQIHNLPDFLVFVGLIPKLTGARLILDIHDLMPEFYAARMESGLDSWPVRLIRWQEQLACRFADHVITVTEPWRKTLIERGVPAEKVSVVMNVADDTIFRRAPATDLSVGSDGCFRLVYHGNLTYRYGVDLAIRAVDLVRHEIPEIYFHIHGAGESLGSLKRLADELDLRDHVHFSSDFVPTSELPKVITQAQVGVVPYRRDVFTDGILPTKLMEYAALGMPAIVARSSAIEAYFDETMVQFFTPGDVQELARCILTLYSDRERLSELAEGAQRFTQCHSWSKIGGDYAALVERLGNR